MAIKGRTKRSQSRTARRITPGPRPVVIERRDPWYKAPAFAVTLALVALLLTSYLAVNRLHYGWQRDDVARFTTRIQPPAQQLTAIAGAGVDDTPGFTSAAELATGQLKPEQLTERAELWGVQIQQATQQLTGVTLGERVPPEDGLPASDVGGRVGALDAVRDSYVAAAGLYENAAATWSLAGRAPEGELRAQLMERAQALADRGQTVLDLAAAQLARLRAHYGLSVAEQLPGESSSAYSERGSGMGS